ncbi:ABC exporter membrane fusion protein [Leptolyngbya sp. 7M]|uniref:ABC exporter membrane fusion protein n=1 Tax=Leptolyngbya sp. 7M TaxID=2812896 RepID=UPI001B8C956A|nr:ABC exporter membrane fusion protein [Leptolyngbya sp. 7M]QYO68282.1 ABC exporter membrane fusion protein [Leptolyngbya sp. 7M]
MQQQKRSLLNSSFFWLLVISLGTIAAGLLQPLSFRSSSSPQSPLSPAALNETGEDSANRVAVAALGRLQPQGDVINLSAPTSLHNARIEKLLVQEGDQVQTGEVVAQLDGYTMQQVAVQQARDRIAIAQARLAQVKAGAKSGEIEAQKASIARLEAELQNAQQELERYRVLYQDGAVSASLLDSKQLVVNTTQKQLDQAKQTLSSIAEVRPVDLQLAQAELESAITNLKQAEAELELESIRAPKAGRILKIHTQAGEVIGPEGVVALGQTDQMYAVAEIYETDINKVQVGQQAVITSPALPSPIAGSVSEIGWQVDRQSVFNVSPSSDTDRRVIQVKIRIHGSQIDQIVALTNLQVEVMIPLQ